MKPAQAVGVLIGTAVLALLQYTIDPPWRYAILSTELVTLTAFTIWITSKLTRNLQELGYRAELDRIRLEMIADKATAAEAAHRERFSAEIDALYELRMASELGAIEHYVNEEHDTVET